MYCLDLAHVVCLFFFFFDSSGVEKGTRHLIDRPRSKFEFSSILLAAITFFLFAYFSQLLRIFLPAVHLHVRIPEEGSQNQLLSE